MSSQNRECVSVAQESESHKKLKRIDIELMRIVASFFVVFNHSRGFYLYCTESIGSFWYWWYLFLSVFCKFSVFLFFCISGSLLLAKKRTIKQTLVKISRTVLSLLVFSIIYFLDECNKKHVSFNLTLFLKHIYCTPARAHLWFLYAYISFLLALPFLDALVIHLTKKTILYGVILNIVFEGIIPSFEAISSFSKKPLCSDLSIAVIHSQQTLYPFLGYYLDRTAEIQKCSLRILLFLWLATILSQSITCYITYYVSLQTRNRTIQRYHLNFVIVQCITIFSS